MKLENIYCKIGKLLKMFGNVEKERKSAAREMLKKHWRTRAEQYKIGYTYRQEKDREFSHSLSFFASTASVSTDVTFSYEL